MRDHLSSPFLLARRMSLTEHAQFLCNWMSSGLTEGGSGPMWRCQGGGFCPGTGCNRDKGRPHLVQPSVPQGTWGIRKANPSCNKYLLSVYYVILGTGKLTVNKTDGNPCPRRLQSEKNIVIKVLQTGEPEAFPFKDQLNFNKLLSSTKLLHLL